MATASSAINAKIRATLNELYGDEKTLIVMNKRDGIVSIGFGEAGDKLGHAIERSKRPIRLTDIFPAKAWLESADFRRCLARGHLEIITEEEADAIEKEITEREEKLTRYANANKEFAATVNRAPSDIDTVPGSQAMVIDEETASMIPAELDKSTQRMAEYMENFGDSDEQAAAEKLRSKKKGRKPVRKGGTETGAPVPVVEGQLNPQVMVVVEGLRKGSLEPMDAILQIEDLKNRISEDDLGYIFANTGKFPGVRQYVQDLITEKSE